MIIFNNISNPLRSPSPLSDPRPDKRPSPPLAPRIHVHPRSFAVCPGRSGAQVRRSLEADVTDRLAVLPSEPPTLSRELNVVRAGRRAELPRKREPK
jgi:hypothetical protein